jgi:integrase
MSRPSSSGTVWFRPAVILGAGLGLRQSEAAGLTLDRVDWLGRAVRVDRQWLSRESEPRFAPPKTSSSIRTIPASAYVLEELSRAGRSVGFVVHRDGEPIDWQTFGHFWRKTRRAAGLPGIRFHDLRHAYASMLDLCGVLGEGRPLGARPLVGGHTLNLYSHLWPGDEDRIRHAVDLALGSAEDSLRTGEALA